MSKINDLMSLPHRVAVADPIGPKFERRHRVPSSLERCRVTVVIPKNLDSNLEALGLVSRRLKTDLVVEALAAFLQRNGIEFPFEAPTVVWRQSTDAIATDADTDSREVQAGTGQIDGHQETTVRIAST